MIMQLTIHEPDGSLRACAGPTRAGLCSLRRPEGALPERNPVPCAGRTVTTTLLGRRGEWVVAEGATRCFVPAIGLPAFSEPGTGPAVAGPPSARSKAA